MSTVPNFAGEWNKFEPKLREEILNAIDYMGFDKMTPVQAATIPQFLGNRDVIVEAVTGSGKTLAFVIPIIEKLMRLGANKGENGIKAIVISPTRELAQQIFNVFETVLNAFRKHEDEDELSDAEGDNSTNVNNQEKSEDDESEEEEPPLKSMLLVGGTNSLADDIKEFKATKPHIIIGTPGRLEDMLVRRKLLPVKQLEVLVLDEADRLLEMGFQSTLTSIISILPKQRRTGLFSATMTEDLNELVRMGLRNPVKVMVKVGSKINQDEQKIPTTLKIQYLVCRPDQKLIQLVRMITRETYQKYILYFNTCACVEYFYKILNSIEELKDVEIISLHGRMDAKKRSATFKKYTTLPDWQRSLLITTDVASRGLDLPDVNKVIQFDAPQDPKAFVHRCGRTARAGKSGFATLFLSPGNEELYPEFMSRRKIPMSEIDYFPPKENQSEKFIWSNEDIESQQLIDRLYQEVFKDRDLVDKGVRAYVSFIKSYTNHLASYIFQVKEFDFSSAAKGYLLLQLPRMPELKGLEVDFGPADIDFDSIPYTNPIREEQRLKALELKASQPKPVHKSKAKKELYVSWSKKKLQLERKINRREEKEKKKQQFYEENTVDGIFIDPKTKPKSLVDLKAHLNEKNSKKSKDKRGLQSIIQDVQQKTKANNHSSDDNSGDSSDGEAVKDWDEFKRSKKQKTTKSKKQRYADL